MQNLILALFMNHKLNLSPSRLGKVSLEKQGYWLAEIINISLKEGQVPGNPKCVVTEHLLKQIWEWLLWSFGTPGAHQYLDPSQPVCCSGHDIKTPLDYGWWSSCSDWWGHCILLILLGMAFDTIVTVVCRVCRISPTFVEWFLSDSFLEERFYF